MNTLDRLAEIDAAWEAASRALPRVGALAYPMVHAECARRVAVASLRAREPR